MNIHSKNTNLGLRHLRAVLAIARHTSFAAAANALAVAPSALTETIRQIETTTGTRLFERRTRPVRPTEAGRLLLIEAEYILQQFDRTLHELTLVGDAQRGQIAVAVVPSLLGHLLAPALAGFHQAHPAISVTVLDAIGERVEHLVRGREADFGLSAQWGDNADLNYTKLASDEFGVVCSTGHPLAQLGRPLRARDLDRPGAIMLGEGNAIAATIRNATQLPEQARTGQFQTHSTIAQLQLVRHGLGFAILPRLAATVLGQHDIVFQPIEDVKLERQLYLVTRRHGEPSPASARLVARIMDIAAGN